MFTLQILDAGQTFLHTLDERPATVGSADTDTVCLREAGVEPAHVRLEPVAGGVTLHAAAPVRVNGDWTRSAELQLGDRIEVGAAVLVVGRTVTRPAGPEDVLAAVPRTARRRRKRASSKLVPVLVSLVLVAVVVAFAVSGDDRQEVRGLLAYVESLRAKGDLAEATAEVARLRASWADSSDGRLEQLAAVEAAIEQVGETRERLEADVLDPTDTRNYAAWSRELQRLEAEGRPDERVAARKVRSRLRELMRRRDEAAVAAAASRRATADGDAGVPTPIVASLAEHHQDPQGASAQDPEDAIETACRNGQYAQALALVQAGYDQAKDAAAVASWRAIERSVRQRAERELATVLREAGAAEQAGQLPQAVARLRAASQNLLATGAFARVAEELARLEAKAAAAAAADATPPASSGEVDEATRLATLQSLRSHMDSVRAAEEQSDYGKAARLLREAAAAVRSRDPAFADRLLARADEAALLVGWHDAVVAAVGSGKKLTTQAANGRALELVRVEGGTIFARSVDGEAPLAWHELDGGGMRMLIEQVRPLGETALGAATLLYKLGEAQAAERVLADAVGADAKLQAAADLVLKRGRADEHGDAGYVLKNGVFVSRRELELADLAKQLGPKLAAVLRKPEAERDAFVRSVSERGALDTEALALAMKQRFDQLLARIQQSSLRKQVDKLVAEREQLDAARRYAKELIFDEVRYFYPYKPPAVSGEKYAEYTKVQAEVSRRVGALRDVWEGSRTKLRVPKKLADDLERLDWLAVQRSRLGGYSAGESVASVLAPVAWARALEPGVTTTLQTFCRTPAERAERAQWRLVRAYNQAVGSQFSAAVRSLLEITNDYRVMFGHRPLAIVASACKGSQGHADEMSQQGYFSHFSPVPERRTPNQRMRLAGYMFGVSENIAKVGGALAAHNAWCRSSGHHRNLLAPNHREIGIGANGRYWVQNFGSGTVHESDPVWLKLAGK